MKERGRVLRRGIGGLGMESGRQLSRRKLHAPPFTAEHRHFLAFNARASKALRAHG